jgi:hypothetical protein
MPLGLHADCKSRLVDALSEALPHIELKNGMFVEGLSAFIVLYNSEKVLPTKGKIRDQLVNYIDERPLTEFVTTTLSSELRDATYISDGPNIKLAELEPYRDAKKLAERFVESLESLPRQYTLTLRLPKMLDTLVGPDKTKIVLSSNVRIVRATSEFMQTFEFETVSDSLRGKLVGGSILGALFNKKAEWEGDALYLQIGVTGYIGIYGGSNTYQDALRTLRSVFGLGTALQLFETKYEYTLAKPSASVVVHQQRADSSWEVVERVELNDTLAGTLNTLRLSKANAWIDSQQKQDAWSERIFEEMRGVFRQEKKAESIILASQWYFDSSHGADELLRYVQSMIVLEIILGDKATSDLMGLNELLRNRCAYLIGKSQEERAELHETFKRIYDVRSQIVHRGKHRLTADERWLLNQLRWMCLRVIQKEVDLLNANKKPELQSPDIG